MSDPYAEWATRYPGWWGFFWLGTPAVPPLPQQFGMTDRADKKTVFYPAVTNDGTHIVFSTAVPTSVPLPVFGPYDGPYVGAYNLRLGIQNAHLVVEQFPVDAGPGPFLRGLSSTAVAAVLFGLISGGGSSFNRLGFQSAAVQGSIFDPTP